MQQFSLAGFFVAWTSPPSTVLKISNYIYRQVTKLWLWEAEYETTDLLTTSRSSHRLRIGSVFLEFSISALTPVSFKPIYWPPSGLLTDSELGQFFWSFQYLHEPQSHSISSEHFLHRKTIILYLLTTSRLHIQVMETVTETSINESWYFYVISRETTAFSRAAR